MEDVSDLVNSEAVQNANIGNRNVKPKPHNAAMMNQ